MLKALMTYFKKGLKPPSLPSCLHWVLKIGWIGVGGRGRQEKKNSGGDRVGESPIVEIFCLVVYILEGVSKGLGWLPK